MQLGLFDEPPAPPAVLQVSVQQAWARALSLPVMAELEDRVNERPGEWLKWPDFDDIRACHGIDCCMDVALSRLARYGRIVEQRVQVDETSSPLPGQRNGFISIYSSVEHGPAPKRETRTPWTTKTFASIPVSA